MRGVYLTTAANDKDLVKRFKSDYPGVSIPVPISHGDFMWDTAEGWDADFSAAIQFCGDRKKIPDLLQCIDDGRHINQVRSAYEAGIRRQALIVEGIIKEGPGDTVVLRKKDRPTETTFSRLKAYLYQLQYLLGVQVIHTRNLPETVREIYHLYLMFQTPAEDHDSLKKFYTAPMTSVTLKPGVLRRVAKELNYIGWERSLEVERRFKTIQDMGNASEEDWAAMEGFGPVMAHSLVKEIQG